MIKKTFLMRGPNWSILHCGLISEGSELNDEVLIDPVSDLELDKSVRLSIRWIEYNFVGFDARLEYESGVVENNLIWTLSRELTCHDFEKLVGGLKDPSGLDGTGKILLNTSGFGAGAQGSLLLKVKYPC